MAIISALDDEPNDVGGLTASELKAKFDEGGEAIKSYINNTLAPVIEEEQVRINTALLTSHMHDNLALLDTYKQTEANLSDAVTARHRHSNKAVLDGISGVTQELGSDATKIPSEAAVSAAIASSGNIPGGGSAGQVLMKNSATTHDMKWGSLTAEDVGAFAYRTTIPANANLDTYLDIGSYFCIAANASSVTNAPVSSAFYLYVLPADNVATRCLQICTVADTGSANTALYYRKHVTSWGDWKQIATADNVLPLTGGTLSGAVSVKGTSASAFKAIRTTANTEYQSSVGVSNYSSEGAIGIGLVDTATGSSQAQLYVTPSKGVRYQAKGSTVYHELLHSGNMSTLGATRIITGTYSGSGKNGSSNANTLTPGWAPKGMAIFKQAENASGSYLFAFFVKGQKGIAYSSGNSDGIGVRILSGTTWGTTNISWYDQYDADAQMNVSGTTYSYIIWG
jgi:hypothetical protein